MNIDQVPPPFDRSDDVKERLETSIRRGSDVAAARAASQRASAISS